MALILGISPGTNHIGFALFKNKELLYWHTQTVTDRQSSKKHRKILLNISSQIAQNNPSHIAVKIPDNFASKKLMTALIAGINILCERYEIKPMYFSLWQMYDVHTHRGLLKELESKLPDYFFKCHRSNIVNMRFVQNCLKDNRKMKGIFNEIITEDKTVKKGKSWNFKISSNRLEPFIFLRACRK